MKTYSTSNLTNLSSDETLWVYNGLDSCITLEVFNHIHPQLESDTSAITYAFTRSLMGPAYTLQTRGIKVDTKLVQELLDPTSPKSFPSLALKLKSTLNTLAHAVWSKPLNPRSFVQLKKFFYTHLNVPPIYIQKKGERKLSCNREALEKIRDGHLIAVPFVQLILKIRELEGYTEVLNRGISKDGRWRFSVKLASTVTGRWATGPTPFTYKLNDKLVREGGSIQNIKKPSDDPNDNTVELRSIFIPDPDYQLFYADLDQAESRGVAALSGCAAYTSACNSGDLHTTVAKLIWPHLGWTDDPQADRKVADTPYYRHFSYRDLAKRAGHATNYQLSPDSLCRHLKIPKRLAYAFHLQYLGGNVNLSRAVRWDWINPGAWSLNPESPSGEVDTIRQKFVCPGAFPGIRAWHYQVQSDLQRNGYLITPLGRKRHFWKRHTDPTTIREAVAYLPQSLISDILNLALLRIWQTLEPKVQLLAQIHDAILFQIHQDNVEEYLPQVLSLMQIPISVNQTTLSIPVSCNTGPTWGSIH